MLTDAGGLALALIAIRFAERPLRRRGLTGTSGWKLSLP